MKRVAIYLRVSTSKQETSNQRRELEAVAKRPGWEVVRVFEDAGISGAKGRDQRPGLDAMLKAVNAREFDMVAAWSVDRLGRSLTDLLNILQGLHDKGVNLFLSHLDNRRQGNVPIIAGTTLSEKFGRRPAQEAKQVRYWFSHVSSWHFSNIAVVSVNVRCWVNSGMGGRCRASAIDSGRWGAREGRPSLFSCVAFDSCQRRGFAGP